MFGTTEAYEHKPRRRTAVRGSVVPQPEENLIRTLEDTGRYRVLRKLAPRAVIALPRTEFPLRGIIVDTETTGLDHRSDEVIEIGIVSFTFDEKGTLGDVTATYGGLQQPEKSIPPEITKLTGITDAMVEGQMIDTRRVRELVEPADLVIAHNSQFDRPFCESLCQAFANKAWACSVSEIDWSARGFEGTKLGYLIAQNGLFHDSHRALDDCQALLEVLVSDGGERTPFAELYAASLISKARIFAQHAPFDLKDTLKARGYRWADGSDGRPKSWWIEVSQELLDEELRYLREEIYGWDEADPPVQHLTAFERFKSNR